LRKSRREMDDMRAFYQPTVMSGNSAVAAAETVYRWLAA
jgi:hypothetical protein